MGDLKPSAACLVVVHDGVAAGLDRCLESIRTAGMEPWVLDDESTDDTFLCAKKHRSQYKHHSKAGKREQAIWESPEGVVRGALTDWALESGHALFSTLDADEWFMSPLTTGQLAREIIRCNLVDSVFMRTVNFWDDMQHVKMFPGDGNYARPRLWKVDRTQKNAPSGLALGVQAPRYAHEGRISCNWNLCVGHTGYLDKAERMAKSKRYLELGAGSWAEAMGNESRIVPWNPETLRGLP